MSDPHDKAVQKALDTFENFVDLVRPKVESSLSNIGFHEITQEDVTYALIRTLIDEMDQQTFEECFTSVFPLLNQMLLEEYGIEISLEDSEKLVNQKYSVIKKEIKKEMEKRKIRISKLEGEIALLDTDFLKAFIERVGNAHFASLALLPKVPIILNTLRSNDIDHTKNTLSEKIIEIEQGYPEVDSLDSQFKNILESMLIIFNDYPKLKAVFEKNEINLNYEELTDLLLNKHEELSAMNLAPSKEALYKSFREATFIHLKESKKNESSNYQITKDDIITSFVACLSAMKTQDTISTMKEYEATFVNVFSEFLNRILIELDAIDEDLPTNEIAELIKSKEEENEIENFENELRSGIGLSANQFADTNINDLSGNEFENYLEELFKKLDYLVIKTPISGDQGADLIIEKSGEKIAVQAKRYKESVTNKAIQEAVAATKHYKCDRAMVVTTSKFTKSAKQLASTNKVELWDGKKLRNVIKKISRS